MKEYKHTGGIVIASDGFSIEVQVEDLPLNYDTEAQLKELAAQCYKLNIVKITILRD